MARLENKVALITGGTSGIGAETARLFIKEGAQVVISGRSEEKGSQLAEELGKNASYCLSDITKEEDIKKAISFTTDSLGKLDILFNNAGGPVGAGLENVTQKDIDYGVHLLLASVILGTRYAIGPMRENGGGCIINNSSIAGIRYRQGDPLYSALKAGVTHFTKMSGVELGKDNIRVNAISAGPLPTLAARSINGFNEMRKAHAERSPLKRNITHEEVANVSSFMLSDLSSGITGSTIPVDSGYGIMGI